MPRGRRGGPRQGTPGTPYPNRSDMRAQPVQAASGQAYGARGAQEAAQRAVPLAGQPVAPQPPGAGGGPPAGPVPGQFGDLLRPTERPGEPVTAGVDVGPGPGSEVMPPAPGNENALHQLRALYAAFPDESLREIIEDIEQEEGWTL